MLLDKAQQIKSKLRFFEGRKVDAGPHEVWKILLCPRDQSTTELIDHCKQDFGYDDIFCALHYRDEIDVYVVYRDRDNYFFESHEQFTGKFVL